jgi:hypothetical protein
MPSIVKMLDPDAPHNHQIKSHITVMADPTGIGGKGAGNSVLLVGAQCIKGGVTVGAAFDLHPDQDFAAPGDDINFTDRAFMAGRKDAVSLQTQKQGT